MNGIILLITQCFSIHYITYSAFIFYQPIDWKEYRRSLQEVLFKYVVILPRGPVGMTAE